MAVFSVEIADADVNRVLSAIASNYGRPVTVTNPDYDPLASIANPDFDPNEPEHPEDNPTNIPDPNQVELIDNPETTYQFANRIVRQFLSEHVAAYELNVARQAAVDSANTSVNINDPAL